MKPSEASVGHRLVGKILPVIICAIGAAIVGGAKVSTAPLNADEGFYLAAAERVTAGMVPYHDFGYTQTPLFPYYLGAVLKVLGFGLIEFRLANVVFFGCTAGLIGLIGIWRGGVWSSLAAVGVFLAAPQVVLFLSLEKLMPWARYGCLRWAEYIVLNCEAGDDWPCVECWGPVPWVRN